VNDPDGEATSVHRDIEMGARGTQAEGVEDVAVDPR